MYYDLDLNDQDPKKLSPVYSATKDKLVWSWKRSDIEKQFVKFTDAELKDRTDEKIWKWKAYDAIKSHLTEAEKNELSQHGYIALTEEEKQAKMTWLATFDGFVQFDDATEKIKVRDQYSNNKLKPSEECFAPYGGNYTYIVVEEWISSFNLDDLLYWCSFTAIINFNNNISIITTIRCKTLF